MQTTTVPTRPRGSHRRPSDATARLLRDEDGMTTAEYAVGTIAACAFAAVLLKVVTSSKVSTLLAGVVEKALEVAG